MNISKEKFPYEKLPRGGREAALLSEQNSPADQKKHYYPPAECLKAATKKSRFLGCTASIAFRMRLMAKQMALVTLYL